MAKDKSWRNQTAFEWERSLILSLRGQLNVRVPKDLHRELVRKAEEDDVKSCLILFLVWKALGQAEHSWISGQTVSPLQKGTARLPWILRFFHVWDSGRVATIGRPLPFPKAEKEWP